MPRTWLLALLVVCTPAFADRPRKVLKGPVPRSEIVSAEAPTPETIARELAAWYPAPKLHRVERIDAGAVTKWKRYFDGVEMDLQPVTSRSGSTWITRFKPERAAPERVRRKKLIGDDAAKKALPGGRTASLLYTANLGLWQLAGTAGTNAMDFVQLVDSWRLVYRVESRERSAYVDAYTGAVLQQWTAAVE